MGNRDLLEKTSISKLKINGITLLYRDYKKFNSNKLKLELLSKFDLNNMSFTSLRIIL